MTASLSAFPFRRSGDTDYARHFLCTNAIYGPCLLSTHSMLSPQPYCDEFEDHGTRRVS